MVIAARKQCFTREPLREDDRDDADFEPTPELEKWAEHVKHIAVQDWHVPRSSALIESPLHVIFAVLRARYNNSLQVFLQKARNSGENMRFSAALDEACGKRGWSVATAKKYATMIKRIVALLPLPAQFAKSLRVAVQQSAAWSKALGKYRKLLADDPVRQKIEAWIDVVREETRNASDLSIRNVIQFFCNVCMPGLDLRHEAWPSDNAMAAHVQEHLSANPDALGAIFGSGSDALLKAKRLQFFLRHILKLDIVVPTPRKRARAQTEPDEDDDGRDMHRFSAEQLDALHTEAQKSLRDELLFILMLTTGLRVGGATKILTRNVAEEKCGRYVIKSVGKTKEKGSKFVTFVIAPQLSQLLAAWLERGRPADDGLYLFPGRTRGSHLSTETIRTNFVRMCHACGIEGPEAHPHSLRHTNAHLLLECGNSAETVSKLLNHSSVSTTQKFYLKESASEVVDRCHIPWMKKETEEEKLERGLKALPEFLRSAEDLQNETTKGPSEDKKRRRAENKARLMEFTGRSSSSSQQKGTCERRTSSLC